MGNNNAYCQDNKISWLDWENRDEALLEYTSKLIHFRLDHPVFCRKKWFQHKPIKGEGVTDIEWFLPGGRTDDRNSLDLTHMQNLSGIFLSGDQLGAQTDRGENIIDDSFFVVFNSHFEPVVFKIPDERWGKSWIKLIDTYYGSFDLEGTLDDQCRG